MSKITAQANPEDVKQQIKNICPDKEFITVEEVLEKYKDHNNVYISGGYDMAWNDPTIYYDYHGQFGFLFKPDDHRHIDQFLNNYVERVVRDITLDVERIIIVPYIAYYQNAHAQL